METDPNGKNTDVPKPGLGKAGPERLLFYIVIAAVVVGMLMVIVFGRSNPFVNERTVRPAPAEHPSETPNG